jgi:hypothetical protein
MEFETKRKIEIATIIITMVVLFSLPVILMGVGI